MTYMIEIALIAVVVAVACSICGVFLVLRKMSMLSDSISHTVILGIVLAYVVIRDLHSPFLLIGAAIIGVFTVFLTETIKKTKIVSEDSSIAVVYPFLFSIAVIIVSVYFKNVHLDTDSVFLGELVFAPFSRLEIFGVDIGPKALYIGLFILVINLVAIKLFFKEIKISTFDPLLGMFIGFSPVLIHYGFVTLVSLTSVGSFEVVGSILVVAFMIIPANTAYLITKDLKKLFVISIILAAVSAIIGFGIAYLLDVSISGMMATISGVIFLLVLIFNPCNGFISIILKRRRQKNEFTTVLVLSHLKSHMNTIDEFEENGVNTINNHIKLNKYFFDKMVNLLLKSNKIIIEDSVIVITEVGLSYLENKTKEIF